MSVWPRYREDWIFLGIIAVFVVLGLAGGLFLPWYSILGLSMICLVIEILALAGINSPSLGVFHTGFLTGIPIMLLIAWVSFWLSLGFRG